MKYTLFVFKSTQVTYAVRSSKRYANSHIRAIFLKALRGNVADIHNAFTRVICSVIGLLIRESGGTSGHSVMLVDPLPTDECEVMVTLTEAKTPILTISAQTPAGWQRTFYGPFFRFTRGVPKAIRAPDRRRENLPAYPPAAPREARGLGRTMRRVRDFLVNYQDFTLRARTDREREYIANGAMPWGMIERMTPIRDRRHLTFVLGRLIRDGEVIQIAHGKGRVYRSRAKAFEE